MDFLDRLIDYIEDNVDLNSKYWDHFKFTDMLLVGNLEVNAKALSIRPTPSSMGNRFMDKGKTREYSFQILSKNPNQIEADRILYEIASLLDGLGNNAIVSDNDSFKLIKCEVYVLPNYVETTPHKEYIYTAMFTAELQGGI